MCSDCMRILCLQAIIEIISNPVNSTVPIASEVLKAAGEPCSAVAICSSYQALYNLRSLLWVQHSHGHVYPASEYAQISAS